ncbi:MAG: nucleotidyltransferase [Bacteroidetes bacterium]|nr:nucleotidyltransferase [Bacteroidota bacterium]
MAAGMGSRYGGIKQIDGFGPNGETIMDYSLYDALRAGFSKFVFVVMEEIQETVKEMFLPKLQGKAEVHFVIQSLEKFVPESFGAPERKKPWGTTHAMLCGSEVIQEPFAVINADDFYGYQAFSSLADFLSTAAPGDHCMVGYHLENVLSEFGSVSRGYAEADANNQLLSLTELTKIVRENGKIIAKEESGDRILNPKAPVSMNCWGFMPDAFNLAKSMFRDFLEKNFTNPSAEYYIALMVTGMIDRKLGSVHILPGGDTWFGVTYREDRDEVARNIHKLVDAGKYPTPLWNQ